MASTPVSIPEYPWFPNQHIKIDEAVLNKHRDEYDKTAGNGRSDERFLFGYLPVVVFDELLDPAQKPDVGASLWLMHLSGYFGGRWLRGEIVKAQPEAMLAGVSIPPSQDGFMAPLGRIDKLMSAKDAASLVATARTSLFDEPSAVEGGEPTRGLGDTFGYNAGYMLEILAAPPQGIPVPAKYQVTCERLLSCDYATPKLKATARLRPVAELLAKREGVYGELASLLDPIQSSGIVRGRAVWSTGLSVQGFETEPYDQLLDVSSSFLETVEGTALTMVKAAVDADPALAEVGIRATAAMIVWLASYMCGLLNGEGTIEIPKI